MENELIDFISGNSLSPFSKNKSSIKKNGADIFKTRDAKAVQTKIFSDISKNFIFPETSNILNKFIPTSDEQEILKRRKFFSEIGRNLENSFMKEVKLSRVSWRPPYGVVVITEDESTFVKLQKIGVPVKILLNERDVSELEDSDIVQVLECENYSRVLERLPQTVFLKNIDEAYPERFVELLSQWKDALEILKNNSLDAETTKLVEEIYSLNYLLEKKNPDRITREQVEVALESVKTEISSKIMQMTVSGSSLIEVISRGAIPPELKIIVDEAIARTNLPANLFLKTIPVIIDENELEKTLRKQSLTEFTSVAEKIKLKSKELSLLPRKFRELEERIILFDFKAGISKWISKRENFSEVGETFELVEAKNLFLESPQLIDFHLNLENRCSILTGANSGGKTTLLEHLIQAVTFHQSGLPIYGKFSSPIFSQIYYFAKNKGSMSKGAFETLLTQMSEISIDDKTLILADEIEAVTEPGVAGKMISATAEYFIRKNCFIVIATHLGQEIQKNVPKGARIDGIEAVGLDEKNELVVNHNPVLGKLANSTPELIVEKMFKTIGGDYFEFLYNSIRKSGNL